MIPVIRLINIHISVEYIRFNINRNRAFFVNPVHDMGIAILPIAAITTMVKVVMITTMMIGN